MIPTGQEEEGVDQDIIYTSQLTTDSLDQRSNPDDHGRSGEATRSLMAMAEFRSTEMLHSWRLRSVWRSGWIA